MKQLYRYWLLLFNFLTKEIQEIIKLANIKPFYTQQITQFSEKKRTGNFAVNLYFSLIFIKGYTTIFECMLYKSNQNETQVEIKFVIFSSKDAILLKIK